MKVLLLGDGCMLTTGFATVLRQIAAELVQRGHDVHQVCSLDVGPRHDSEAYRKLGVTPYFTNPYDYCGFTVLREVFKQLKPDVVLINADPGTCYLWFERLIPIRGETPIVIYAPVEGAPVCATYAEAFRLTDVAYTYTQWSSDALKQEHGLDVPWLYHGVSPDFAPLDAGLRRAVRNRLGWTDKFVVMYVARNAGRKSQDVLIKAMAELKAQGIDDVQLYLHCKSFDNNQLQGWDLAFLSHWCGVTDRVEFSNQTDPTKGEESVSLIQKYGAADLYVHPAQVEGFGLPILEAMASGLPTVITDDEGNMAEVVGDASLAKVHPYSWGTWFNGAQLAVTHQQQWAGVIKAAKDRPKECKAAGERSRQRAKLFRWEPMRETLANAVEAAVAGKKAPVVEGIPV